MTGQVGIILVVCLTGGLIAGSIAYTRLGNSTGAFVGYFIFGALFPLIGIIVAAVVKPAPQPPGWYPDPWVQNAWRWFDGAAWTWQTSADVVSAS